MTQPSSRREMDALPAPGSVEAVISTSVSRGTLIVTCAHRVIGEPRSLAEAVALLCRYALENHAMVSCRIKVSGSRKHLTVTPEGKVEWTAAPIAEQDESDMSWAHPSAEGHALAEQWANDVLVNGGTTPAAPRDGGASIPKAATQRPRRLFLIKRR